MGDVDYFRDYDKEGMAIAGIDCSRRGGNRPYSVDGKTRREAPDFEVWSFGGSIMGKKRLFGFVEAVFDILYLGVVFVLGLYLLLNAHQTLQVLCGVTALVLVGGDSFHLVPRILSIVQNDRKRHQRRCV